MCSAFPPTSQWGPIFSRSSISASYGTFTHAVKGNVDILIALVMHTGAVIGAQIGVVATQYFAGPKIRLAFVPLPLIGVAIVMYT